MRNPKLAHCLFYPLVFAVAPGCQVAHPYRPVAVQAVDAETRKPVPGADVRISYFASRSFWPPRDCFGASGTDGIVRLRAAPPGDAGLSLDVTATGYLSASQVLLDDAVRAIGAP
jgi:hypothetical protein